MEEPEGYGGETLPGVSEKGREGQTKPGRRHGGRRHWPLGCWSRYQGECKARGEDAQAPSADSPSGGQQKLSCELHGCGAHSYRALRTDGASEGPRGPGVEEDGVWEPSPGALAGGGGGCSCVGSRSVIRAW